MEKIKIALVEDDKEWANAMLIFLRSHNDFEVVGLAHTREDSLKMAKTTDIDVLIMDISLNGVINSGIYAVIDILQIKSVKVVMLSGLKAGEIIKDAFTAGATDYIYKENFCDLPFVIRRVFRKDTPSEILVNEFRRLKKEEQIKDLTPSEKELLDLLGKGYKLPEIEKNNFKSINTLKQQVRSILKKLNVRSSKDALNKVSSCGLAENKVLKRK